MRPLLLAIALTGCTATAQTAEPAPTVPTVWADPTYRVCAELPQDMCRLGCVQLAHLECAEAGATIGACREACELAQATCRVRLDMGCVARLTTCGGLDACRVACDRGCP